MKVYELLHHVEVQVEIVFCYYDYKQRFQSRSRRGRNTYAAR